MASLGVNIAILSEDKILLTRREDFEVWCLPGGAVDDQESVAEAAIREAREETGLEVELTRMVGIYSRPHWHSEGSHAAVLAARVIGGALRLQQAEVLEARFFRADELPEMILFGQRRRILDALSGIVGAVWTQDEKWPFPQEMTRQELYALRDSSGLSRQEFYRRYFVQCEIGKEVKEIEPLTITA